MPGKYINKKLLTPWPSQHQVPFVMVIEVEWQAWTRGGIRATRARMARSSQALAAILR